MYPWNENRFVLFDGGMGTQLQKRISEQILPEEVNLRYPEVLETIQREYAEVGADILTTNTFGANPFKLKKVGLEPEPVIKAAVETAKKAAGDRLVALDIGPLGIFLEPNGELGFEEAYEAFKVQVVAGAKAGCDLILIETMSDLQEARCAVLAAKENTDLPVFCTMTFGEKGRTLVGNDPSSMVATLEGLGVDAIGVNCSLGPDKLLGIVEEILTLATVPVMVQPNAGMPVYRDGETSYDITKEHFARILAEMADMGVKILGGCCGTDASYIGLLKGALRGKTPVPAPVKVRTVSSSHRKSIDWDDQMTVISENLLPHGNKEIMEAYMEEDCSEIAMEAREIGEEGAHLVDIRTAGLPGKDEKSLMVETIREIQSFSDMPLMLDSSDPQVLEAALRIYNGKAVVNGLDGTKKNMEGLFPVVKKYGAAVVALTLDEAGVPEDWKGRLKIAKAIMEQARKYGIPAKDVIFDPVVLPVARGNDVMACLKAAAAIKEELGAKILFGIGNISYRMPERGLLNRGFLSMAASWGMDALLMNVYDEKSWKSLQAACVLAGKDPGGMDYAAGVAKLPKALEELDEEANVIYTGNLDGAESSEAGTSSITQGLLAAEDAYRAGEIYLPNLRRSVEAAKRFVGKARSKDASSRGTILFAYEKNPLEADLAMVLSETLGFTTGKWDGENPGSGLACIVVEAPFIFSEEDLKEKAERVKKICPGISVVLMGPGAVRADWKGMGLSGAVSSGAEWMKVLEALWV